MFGIQLPSGRWINVQLMQWTGKLNELRAATTSQYYDFDSVWFDEFCVRRRDACNVFALATIMFKLCQWCDTDEERDKKRSVVVICAHEQGHSCVGIVRVSLTMRLLSFSNCDRNAHRIIINIWMSYKPFWPMAILFFRFSLCALPDDVCGAVRQHRTV